MLTVDRTKNKYNVTVNPIIDSIDEDNDARSTSSSQTAPPNIDTRSTATAGYDDGPRQTTIKLRTEWAMIAAHKKFNHEYQEFIRNKLQTSSFISSIISSYFRQ